MIPLHDDLPSNTPPRVTVAIMVACVVVFLLQLTGGEAAFYSYGLVPAVLFGEASLPPDLVAIPAWLTIFTSMFMHGGFMHLAGNMLYLWIFGNNVEDSMGHTRFIVFYVLCGIGAAMAQAFADPGSEVPMIGASGAIGGVLGAYFLLHPNARVLVVIPLGIIIHPMRIPAFVVLGLWFVFQLFAGGVPTEGGGGVAYWAHVGGFVAGALLVIVFKRRDAKLWNFRGPHLSAPPGFEDVAYEEERKRGETRTRNPFRSDPNRRHFNPFDRDPR